MEDKTFIIDIREEFEITELYLTSTNTNCQIIYIPSRIIFKNQEYIRRLAHLGKVWLLCASSRRSDKVKMMYFTDEPNILSSSGGIKFLCEKNNKINEDLHIPFDFVQCVRGEKSFGPTQYMQFAFVFMLIMVAALSLFLEKKWFLGVVGVMIILVLYQAVSKSCWLSAFIPLKA